MAVRPSNEPLNQSIFIFLVYEQLACKFRNIGARFQLQPEQNYSGNGRDIKIVTNKFINSAEDIDV